MSNKPKRVVLTLYDPDITKLIDSIPKGYRSMIVEAALISFVKNKAAQSIIELLICRRKGKKQGKIMMEHKDNKNDVADIFSKLKGDFD